MRRLPVWAVLLACALLCATAVWQLSTPPPTQALPAASRVVVVGVPGLTWADVDATTTPNLRSLAEHAALGSLTTRGASSFACPRDGWVTLGAGNRALFGSREGGCRTAGPSTESAVVNANLESPYDADPGLLGGAVRCTRTFGADAALAVLGADNVLGAPVGRRSPAGWRAGWGDCPLALVAAPVLRADETRELALHRVDALVGRVATAVAAEPETLLLVVGVSDSPGGHPAMRVAMAATGPALEGSSVPLLRSASTGRIPYVQLIDVAPTALTALGTEPPTAMAGRPMVETAETEPPGTALTMLRTDGAAAEGNRIAAPSLVWAWVVLTAICIGAAVILLTIGDRTSRTVRTAGIAAGAAPIASLLADVVPWQATDRPTLWLALAWAGTTTALTVVAIAGPWRSATFGPHVALAAIGVLVVGLDVTTGSSLQLNALLGYSPVVAGRFTGLGNMPFAIFATCALLALGAAVPGQPRRTVWLLTGAVGATMVLVVGAPGLGADVGGVMALVPALLVLGMVATGIRVSVLRGAAALGAGVAVVAVLAIADYQRSAQSQTHLGRFVGQVMDGTALSVIERKGQANLNLLLHSPVATLAPVLLVTLVWLFATSGSAGRALLASAGSAGRAALAGATVAAVLGSLLNDSGVAVFVAAASIAVPLLLSAVSAATSPADGAVGAEGQIAPSHDAWVGR